MAVRLRNTDFIHALRTTTQAVVTTCLASSSPMLVWCGGEHSLAYNDAAIPLLGSAHPAALGRIVPDETERWRSIRSELALVVSERAPRRAAGLQLTPVFDGDDVVAILGAPLDPARATVPRDDDDGRARVIVVDETRKANRAKDDFLSIVGHELRNPLSTMSTMLQALLLSNPTSELELMERSLRQLSHLVEDLLESSRLSRGTIPLDPTIVEIADVIDRAMEQVAPLFQRAHIRLTIDVPRSGFRIGADIDRLARAIANVLTNAAQHTPAEHEVRVRATRAGGRIQLRIADDGAGIAPDRLSGMFQAFQHDRRDGGLGLGLAMARSIVELHHGSISLTSAGTGRGTECVIDVPATEDPVRTPAVPRTAKRRLLVVEDNDDAARALKLGLEQLGYEVALAHDAPIAINLARTFHPDVALLDLGLPVMDGWELARRLRDAARALPIVAVTARDQDTDRQRSSELGFAEHLVKPIDLPRLKRIVDELSASAASEA